MRKLIWFTVLFLALALFTLGGVLWYSNWKAEIMKIPPEAPSNLVTESLSATDSKLIWRDNSNNELGFQVIRDGQTIGDLPEGSEEYLDGGLRPATNYRYEVIAYNLAGKNTSGLYVARTKNPPIRVWIDKIGVADNGEDYFRELLDKSGEIFIGMVIKDGETTFRGRLPANNFYHLADDEVIDLGILAFTTDEIGGYLLVDIIGFENDGGLGDELLSRALDMTLKASMGGLSSLILTLAEVDFTDTFKEVIGFEDDYLGEYQSEWTITDDWGADKDYNIDCKNNDGNIGLRLWFRIECPVYDYSSEAILP